MVGKYNSKRYEEFGLFIIPDKRSDGYKVVRDDDGWISDMTHKDKKSAQKFIDDMIYMIDNSKAKWNGIIHN